MKQLSVGHPDELCVIKNEPPERHRISRRRGLFPEKNEYSRTCLILNRGGTNEKLRIIQITEVRSRYLKEEVLYIFRYVDSR